VATLQLIAESLFRGFEMSKLHQKASAFARPTRPKYQLVAQFRNRLTREGFWTIIKEGDKQDLVAVTRSVENLRDHCFAALLKQSGIYLSADLIEVEETTIELVK
jgi:site-specific recombinase XerD